MSGRKSGGSSEGHRFEFTVSVELYIHTAVGSGLRKVRLWLIVKRTP